MENKNSYSNILKATGLFGFTQLFKLVIGVVNSKLISVFLGPVGMGVFGLLNNTIAIITSATGFGISISGVKAVVDAKEESEAKLNITLQVLKVWSLVTGGIAALFSIIFSSFLSQWTFGTTDKYYYFIYLALAFLATSFATTQMVILQGLRKIKLIGLVSVLSAFLSLLVNVPLYYFYKIDGLLPAIIATAFIYFLVHWYFTRNLKTAATYLSFKDYFAEGRPLIKLGFLLSLNSVFGYLCAFLIKLFLNQQGQETALVGFYEVSTVILISYLGLIFNAMGSDYYPRLTAVKNDNFVLSKLVNDQIEIGLLIVVPAVFALYFIAPWLIPLLYSKDFSPVLDVLKLGLFAVILKTIIWPLSFVILAKGNNKQYFKQELISDALYLMFTYFLFKKWGLVGVGFAMVLHFLTYGFYIFYFVNKNYQIQLQEQTKKLIYKVVVLSAFLLVVVFLTEGLTQKALQFVLLILSFVFVYKEFNKRVDVLPFLRKIKTKLSRSKSQ
jgi:O-antigen/teichoic acid export membrane protein